MHKKNENTQLSGLVERITYHNPENGFCVVKVKVNQKKDLIAVLGYISVISVGEQLEGTGEWIQDKQHGLQFKAETLKTAAPTSLEDIEKYLASGLIKGIGPIYAKKLIEKFGKDVFEIIETQKHRLREVAGIGQMRASKIGQSWDAQATIRQIMLFLHSHSLSTAKASKIYKTYGVQAIDIIKANPYKLAEDIRNIGFKSADQIAESLGISKDSIVRARAGVTHTLATAMNDGHCGLPVTELLNKCSNLLEIPEEIINTALELELKAGTVLREYFDTEEGIYLTGLANAEDFVANKIYEMSKGAPPWSLKDVQQEFESRNHQNSLNLSASQIVAIEQALKSKILIITGGPGVGKTTIVKTIVKILKAKNVDILLAAPTGRAAKRLSESTGEQAKTIHRLLRQNPDQDRSTNFGVKLKCDLLILDEASMIDILLMQSVISALPYKAALILVGDVDQLPSVGPGQILQDLINSQKLPVTHLTEIFRQNKDSNIIANAHLINQRKMPILDNDENSDFFFVNAETPEDAVKIIIKLMKERIPKKFGFSGLQDIQVLTPMAKGIIGSRNLNLELQKVLNDSSEEGVQNFGITFKTNDKIMQIENNYDKDVYNGDIGIISRIDATEQEVCINYDGREVVYEYSELDEIVLAYATTIHKSQGSEYQAIIIPVMTQHYNMLQKNLIYTAITRGKKLVVVVGQKKALESAINNKSQKFRYTNLTTKLNRTANIDTVLLAKD